MAHTKDAQAYGPGTTRYSIIIQGTIAELDEKTQGLFTAWYEKNSAVLYAHKIIPDIGDATRDLSQFMIKADYVGIYPTPIILIVMFSIAVLAAITSFVTQLIEGQKARKSAAPKEAEAPNTAETTETTAVPEIPDTSETEDAPETADAPESEDAPEVTETPEPETETDPAPETTDEPKAEDEPEADETSETPEAEEQTETPADE